MSHKDREIVNYCIYIKDHDTKLDVGFRSTKGLKSHYVQLKANLIEKKKKAKKIVMQETNSLWPLPFNSIQCSHSRAEGNRREVLPASEGG